MRRGLAHPSLPERAAPARRAAPRAAQADAAADGDDAPMSVSEVTRVIKNLLEGRVGSVAVAGEAAGVKPSPSGHVYFAVKDSGALLDCVIWRSTAERLRALPKDGEKIVLRGRLSVYEPRGRYQLVVTSVAAEGGKGDLWKRFEELKERLAAEGLFAPGRKKPLPESPKVIGIVTSPGGAALRDMITILSRRAPNVRIVVSPALVQGRGAAEDVARAIRRLEDWGKADVLVVGRGGGSLEDLWAFNEEPVARAIAAAATPVVSAVGHETDFTIADFVADARAATPSEAAERIAPDQSHLRGRVAHTAMMLRRALAGLSRERRERLRSVARERLYRQPLEMFQTRWQRMDDVAERFAAAMEARLARLRSRRDVAEARLSGLSPLSVLERGYAVVLDDRGRAVVDASGLRPGAKIVARLHRGAVDAVVEKVRAPDGGEPEKTRALF